MPGGFQENPMAYTGPAKLGDSVEVLLQKLLDALGGAPFLGATQEQTLINLVNVVVAAGGGGGGGGSYLPLSGGTLTGALSGTSATFSGALGAASAALTGAVTASTVSAANGTLVASAPAVSLSQTWNNAGVTFTGFLGAITSTAANSNSNLFNYMVDGVDRFNFTLGGSFRAIKVFADDTGPNLFLRKRGATGDATAAIASGGAIGACQFSGWDSAAFQNGASIICNTTEVWSGAARGTYMDFQTTTQGGTSLVSTLRLQGNRVGFFAATPALKQTSGENLTNNVTSGGTDGTIANFTDLVVYANDAAAIRNDLYQLSRKLKQVNDALRTYGLLT